MESHPTNFRFEDFNVESPISQGAFGQIYRAVELKSGAVYALKVLNRRFLTKMKKENIPTTEKEALRRCKSPFVIELFGTFKDPSNLFFVLEFAPHGDLHDAISKLGHLSNECSRVLAAQLLMAVSDVHKSSVIHRDVKPENILLDERNHVKLADFGSAMVCSDIKSDLRRSSIVGTPAFVAPEILTDGEICYASDIWSVGCTIFNMLTGAAPFDGETTSELMTNISELKFSEAISSLQPVAKDLILNLLRKKPQQRLGFGEEEGGYPSIRAHPFFKGVKWEQLKDLETPNLQSNEPSIAVHILHENEKVLLEGIVERKRRLSWKQRALLVTSEKRLICMNMENQTVKLDVELSNQTKTDVSANGKEWSVTWAPGKSQLFRCKDGSGDVWTSTIMKAALNA